MYRITCSLVCFIIAISYSALFADIKIVKKKDFKVKLGFNTALNFEVDKNEEAFGFVVDAAKISLTSEYKNLLKLYISIDPSKPNSSSKSSYSEPLDKLYLQWKANENVRFRAGQFKIPFGHEQFEGLEERSLISHRKSTKEICPDLDRGVMIYGKKISGWFSYYTGLFNGTSVEQSLNSATVLVPLKLRFDQEFNRTNLTFGVNSYLRANRPYSGEMKYRWGNGIFSELSIETSRDNSLTFLAEFLEKLDFRDLKTSEKAWEVGGFLISTYRNGIWEPVLFTELYDKDITLDNEGDKLLLGGGLNIHFFDDNLRFSCQVEYESLRYSDNDNITGSISIRGFL